MSWSVSAIGKSGAVKTAMAQQFKNGSKCLEPEERIRLAAANLIDLGLDAQDPSSAVKVEASGSQTFKDYAAKTGVSNTVTISIQPQGAFIE